MNQWGEVLERTFKIKIFGIWKFRTKASILGKAQS